MHCCETSCAELVLYPDLTLCEGKGLVTFEHFLGSCKLNILILRKPIRSQLYDFASCCVAMLYKVSFLVVAQANQNAALQFCIAMCILACD